MTNQEFPYSIHVLYTMDAIILCNLCGLPNATQNYLVLNVLIHKQNLCTIYLDENKNKIHDGDKHNFMGIKITVIKQILPTGTMGYILIFTHWYIYLDILWE